MPSPQTPERPRWGLAVVALFVTTAGYALGFLVADHLIGRAGALGALLALLVAPLGAGVLVERIAWKLGGSVRPLRVALALLPLAALLLGGFLLVEVPEVTGRALATIPARYPGIPRGLGDLARRAGEALLPASPPASSANAASSAPSPSASSSAAADSGSAPSGAADSRSAPSGAADSRSAPSVASAAPSASAPSLPATGARFSAGDLAYAEPDDACDSLADVTDLAAAYKAQAPRATIEGLARRRYAAGVPFLQVQTDAVLAAWLGGAPSTFDGVVSRFDAAVHEGSHIWGANHSSASSVSYSVRTDLTIEARRLTNFHRSEILAAHVDGDGDSYAKTYLSGSSGAQGFNTLLDEYNAYTHSLAAHFCARDLLAPHSKVSARDGILTLMYYVEVYLRLAREKHAADYAAILKDPGHRRLILTVWSRAELWLRRSAPFPALGIHDARIEGWAYATEGLAEIARVRDADRR
jgi:hypothetical protein